MIAEREKNVFLSVSVAKKGIIYQFRYRLLVMGMNIIRWFLRNVIESVSEKLSAFLDLVRINPLLSEKDTSGLVRRTGAHAHPRVA